MGESDVKVIVTEALDAYEERTGLPRHKENLENFRKLFALANKAIGIGLACTAFCGIPALIASLIVIVRFVRGH